LHILNIRSIPSHPAVPRDRQAISQEIAKRLAAIWKKRQRHDPITDTREAEMAEQPKTSKFSWGKRKTNTKTMSKKAPPRWKVESYHYLSKGHQATTPQRRLEKGREGV